MSFAGFPKPKPDKSQLNELTGTPRYLGNNTANSVPDTLVNITGSGWLMGLFNMNANSGYYVQVTIDGVQVIPDTGTSISISTNKYWEMFYRFEKSLIVKASHATNIKGAYLLD
jgi:hypothetical protein